MRLTFTLFILLFNQFFLNVAYALPSSRVSAKQGEKHVSQAKPDERRKRKVVAKSRKKPRIMAVKEKVKLKSYQLGKMQEKQLQTNKVAYKHPVDTRLVRKKAEKTQQTKTISHSLVKAPADNSGLPAFNAPHKNKYLHAKETAMNKLMHQMGKPYRWGGASPNTGFDCSGLVYYAYKDLMRIKLPRTANEMYHLRDAAPVKRRNLESGDLVFFQITKHDAVDHVGVYLGNGKFIQSPRTGEDIRISYLANNYWQQHYVGARRVMTPKTIL